MKVSGLLIGLVSLLLFYIGTHGEFGHSKQAMCLIIILGLIALAGFSVWMIVPL